MKKRHKSRSVPGPRRVSYIDKRRFQGDITTIFYNMAAVVVYAVFLKFLMDDVTGAIAFFALAVIQMTICAVLGFNYNSKMWLISAFAIFLMSCLAFAYMNM